MGCGINGVVIEGDDELVVPSEREIVSSRNEERRKGKERNHLKLIEYA